MKITPPPNEPAQGMTSAAQVGLNRMRRSPFMRHAERLAALLTWYRKVCLAGDTPTCSVPAKWGHERLLF